MSQWPTVVVEFETQVINGGANSGVVSVSMLMCKHCGAAVNANLVAMDLHKKWHQAVLDAAIEKFRDDFNA